MNLPFSVLVLFLSLAGAQGAAPLTSPPPERSPSGLESFAIFIITVTLTLLFFFLLLVIVMAIKVRMADSIADQCRIRCIKRNKMGETGVMVLNNTQVNYNTEYRIGQSGAVVKGMLFAWVFVSAAIQSTFQVMVVEKEILSSATGQSYISYQLGLSMRDPYKLEVVAGEKISNVTYCSDGYTYQGSCNESATCHDKVGSFFVESKDQNGFITGFPGIYDCKRNTFSWDHRIRDKNDGNVTTLVRRKRDSCHLHSCGHVMKCGSPCSACNQACCVFFWRSSGPQACFVSPGAISDLISSITTVAEVSKNQETRLLEEEIKSLELEAAINITKYTSVLTDLVLQAMIHKNEVNDYMAHVDALNSRLYSFRMRSDSLRDSTLYRCQNPSAVWLFDTFKGTFDSVDHSQMTLNMGEYSCLRRPDQYSSLVVMIVSPRNLNKTEEYGVLTTIPYNVKTAEGVCNSGRYSKKAFRMRDGKNMPWPTPEIEARNPDSDVKWPYTSNTQDGSINPLWQMVSQSNMVILPELAGSETENGLCPNHQLIQTPTHVLLLHPTIGGSLDGVNFERGVTMITRKSQTQLLMISGSTYYISPTTQDVNVTFMVRGQEQWESFQVLANGAERVKDLGMSFEEAAELRRSFENQTMANIEARQAELTEASKQNTERLQEVVETMEKTANQTAGTAGMAVAVGSTSIGMSGLLTMCCCVVICFGLFKLIRSQMEGAGSHFTHQVVQISLKTFKFPGVWLYYDKVIEPHSRTMHFFIFLTWKLLPRWRFLIRFKLRPVDYCIESSFMKEYSDIQDEVKTQEGEPRPQQMRVESPRTPADDDAPAGFPALLAVQTVRRFMKRHKNRIRDIPAGGLGDGSQDFDDMSSISEENEMGPTRRSANIKEVTQSGKVSLTDDYLVVNEQLFNQDRPYQSGVNMWWNEGDRVTNGHVTMTAQEFEDDMMSEDNWF